MMIDQTKNLSYQLRLFGIQQSLERRIEESVTNKLHPAESLRLLLEDELLFRKERGAKASITRAKFRFDADLEDWDQTYDRGITKQKIKEIFQLCFYHNNENLVLVGKTGEGKTHLAIAIGKRLCQEGFTTLFIPVNLLFEEITAERAAGRYLPYIRKIAKAKAIILDDFGLRSYTHEEAMSLMDILEDRYQKSSIIVTSQVNPKGWGTLFEDPVTSEAIVDRLINPSQIITTKGGSYREKIEANKKKVAESRNKL